MQSLYNSLFWSGGLLFWLAVILGSAIVLNLFIRGVKDVIKITFLLTIVVGAWHFYNKNRLNTYLQTKTCAQLKVEERFNCVAIHDREYVTISVYEKDQKIRFEKFYRENEYQINRQVGFRTKETCKFYSFCRYDFERMNQEFSFKKDRIQLYLTQDLNKRIYFE